MLKKYSQKFDRWTLTTPGALIMVSGMILIAGALIWWDVTR